MIIQDPLPVPSDKLRGWVEVMESHMLARDVINLFLPEVRKMVSLDLKAAEMDKLALDICQMQFRTEGHAERDWSESYVQEKQASLKRGGLLSFYDGSIGFQQAMEEHFKMGDTRRLGRRLVCSFQTPFARFVRTLVSSNGGFIQFLLFEELRARFNLLALEDRTIISSDMLSFWPFPSLLVPTALLRGPVSILAGQKEQKHRNADDLARGLLRLSEGGVRFWIAWAHRLMALPNPDLM